MDAPWQISAGDLFELLRPAAFVISLLLSTWVLHSALFERDARNERRWPLYAVALWTLFTLLLPAITFPLYLALRLLARRREQTPSAVEEATEETTAASEAVINDEVTVDEEAASDDAPAVEERAPLLLRMRAASRRLALPLLYAAVVFACGAVYFYRDYASADAHLARASRAKLNGRHELAAREYRAALAQEDDPHTRKLLGLELAAAEKWEEALAELRAAESAGEPDAALPFHIAKALETLGRDAEALVYYGRFAASHACEQPVRIPYRTACRAACERLRASEQVESFCQGT